MLQRTMFLQIIGLALAAGAVPIAANDVTTNCAVPNIYVASYAGGVYTLQYTEGQNELKELGVTQDCGPKDLAEGVTAPVMWLENDKENHLLYCSEETAGTISSVKADEGGKLTGVGQVDIAYAAMSSALFNKDGNRAIAVANYSPAPEGGENNGPGITILEAPKDGKLKQIQYVEIPLTDATGEAPQNVPHPHQVLLDPTGKFIIVPDLGSDKLRAYSIDLSNNNISPGTTVDTAKGSGPRHGIFWSPDGPLTSYKAGGKLYYFLLHEMANTLVSYDVTYPSEGKIEFKQVDETNTFGGAPPPEAAVASEVQISADNKFFYAANRLDNSYTIPAHFGNDTVVPSDSIGVFSPQPNGALAFVQLAAAGGVNPRHFSLNKRGDLALVGFMTEGVVLLKRDPATGRLGEPVARTPQNKYASITTSIFDE